MTSVILALNIYLVVAILIEVLIRQIFGNCWLTKFQVISYLLLKRFKIYVTILGLNLFGKAVL